MEEWKGGNGIRDFQVCKVLVTCLNQDLQDLQI